MAKQFGGLGGVFKPAAPAAGGPMASSPRPMARPGSGMGLGGVEVQSSRPQGGFLAQRLGPQGSDARYEMAMQLLQSAMSSAAGSNSPAMAFLTPILGSVIGARVEKLRGEYLDETQGGMAEAMLGRPLSVEAQQALDVMNDPNAPDYLKDIARTMFKDSAVPVGQMAKPARRSSGGGAAKRPARLTYITKDADGVYRGYNPATGKREVVPNADAAPSGGSTFAPDAPLPSTPPLPPDPVLPRDPSLSPDDELLRKYLD